MTFHILTLLPPFIAYHILLHSFVMYLICRSLERERITIQGYSCRISTSAFLFTKEMCACVRVRIHFKLAVSACAENLHNSFIRPYVVLHTCMNVFVKSTVYYPEQGHHAKRRLVYKGHEGCRSWLRRGPVRRLQCNYHHVTGWLLGCALFWQPSWRLPVHENIISFEVSDSRLNILNYLHSRLGRRDQSAFVLLPEAPGTRVAICAQFIVLLLVVLFLVITGVVLARLHIVKTQGVDPRVLWAGWWGAVVHFRTLLALWGRSLGYLGWLILNVLIGWPGRRDWRRLSRNRHRCWRPLNIAHLAIDPFYNVVINKKVRDDAESGGLWAGWSSEFGGRPEETLGQGDRQVYGVSVIWGRGRDWCGGELAHTGHRLVDIFTYRERE